MMEHEQINDKTVALSIKSVKLTGNMLAKAMQEFLKKAREPTHKHGKQSLESLTKQGASLADIDISGNNIGTFKRIARKYNIDFALKRDNSAEPPKWIVFFKAKDDKALQSAFNEYAKVTLKQKERKVPMLAKLAHNKSIVKSTPTKSLNKVKNITR